MNKKLLVFSIALFGIAAKGYCQPTLTASANVPIAGTSMTYHANGGVSAGPSGANQVWDFSGQPSGTSASATYTTCAATPNCGSFPGATIASNDGSGNYGYFITSPTAMSLTGAYSQGTAVPYSDPEDMLRFPFSYGNSFVDNLAANFVGGAVTFYRSGNDSTVADGWGKLILPNATFNNTLRIKKVQTYRDSAVGFPINITYKSTIYYWYSANSREFLFTTGTLTTTTTGGSPQSSSYSRYTNQTPTGITGINELEQSLKLYPNPAKDAIHLSFTATRATAAGLKLLDVTGRTVAEIQSAQMAVGTHVLTIPLNGLSNGFYLAQLQVDGTTITRKVQVQ